MEEYSRYPSSYYYLRVLPSRSLRLESSRTPRTVRLEHSTNQQMAATSPNRYSIWNHNFLPPKGPVYFIFIRTYGYSCFEIIEHESQFLPEIASAQGFKLYNPLCLVEASMLQGLAPSQPPQPLPRPKVVPHAPRTFHGSTRRGGPRAILGSPHALEPTRALKPAVYSV